jgi:hypothetical protein
MLVRVSILLSVCGLAVPLALAGADHTGNPGDRPQQSGSDELPSTLFPRCPSYTFTPVAEIPDKLVKFFSDHKRYRLVIGVSEFEDKGSKQLNRPYAEQTARLIDARLAELGYAPLPSLRTGQPYLSGPRATKSAIMASLRDMEQATREGDLGVIYYIGHGTITLNNKDLSLAVYDRPVAADEGIRASDLFATLELSEWRSDLKEIPHFIVVLETCYSGVAALGSRPVLWQRNGLQTIAEISNQVFPPQIAVLTATIDGDDKRAYDLHGTNESAFGFFFIRALGEDWECADTTPDGILTLPELKNYLTTRLELAHQLSIVDGSMEPVTSSAEAQHFIAYSPDRHFVDGDRSAIVRLLIKPPSGSVADVQLPSGRLYSCNSTDGCNIIVSASLGGKLLVSRRLEPVTTAGVFGPTTGAISKSGIDIFAFLRSKPRAVDLHEMISRKSKSKTVAGISIQIR